MPTWGVNCIHISVGPASVLQNAQYPNSTWTTWDCAAASWKWTMRVPKYFWVDPFGMPQFSGLFDFRMFTSLPIYQFTVNGRLNKPIVVREQASVKSPIWACFRFRTARDPEMKKTLLTYVENIGVTFIGLFPVDKWPHSTIVLIGKHIHGWNHGRMYLNGKLNLGTRIHVLRSWKRARETLIGYNSVTRSDGGTTGKS